MMKGLRYLLLTFCFFVEITQLKACPSKSGTPERNNADGGLKMTKLGNKCYYFEFDFEKSLNWTSAQQFCRSHGLQLASIETEEENNLIVQHCLKDAMHKYVPLHYWLGGSDEEQEGTWRWPNGQQFNFTDWGPYQPSNWMEDADYLKMSLLPDGTHEWDDTPPKYDFVFICKKMEVC